MNVGFCGPRHSRQRACFWVWEHSLCSPAFSSLSLAPHGWGILLGLGRGLIPQRPGRNSLLIPASFHLCPCPPQECLPALPASCYHHGKLCVGPGSLVLKAALPPHSDLTLGGHQSNPILGEMPDPTSLTLKLRCCPCLPQRQTHLNQTVDSNGQC